MTEQEINRKAEECVRIIHAAEESARDEARMLIVDLNDAVNKDVAPPAEIIDKIKVHLKRVEKCQAYKEKASREIDDLNELAEELYSNRA